MFINNTDGIVLPFVAMLLPVLMLIGVLIIDGGNLYIRKEQIQYLSKGAANSSVLALEDILEKKAKLNYNSLCIGALPSVPSVCSSSDIFNFLTAIEVQNIILNIGNQNLVKNSAINFIKDFDPELDLISSNITVNFPYEYSGGNSVKVLVKIKTKAKGFFKTLLPSTREVESESKSFLNLH